MEKRKGRKREVGRKVKESERNSGSPHLFIVSVLIDLQQRQQKVVYKSSQAPTQDGLQQVHICIGYTPTKMSLVWMAVCIITRSMLVQCAPA